MAAATHGFESPVTGMCSPCTSLPTAAPPAFLAELKGSHSTGQPALHQLPIAPLPSPWSHASPWTCVCTESAVTSSACFLLSRAAGCFLGSATQEPKSACSSSWLDVPFPTAAVHPAFSALSGKCWLYPAVDVSVGGKADSA